MTDAILPFGAARECAMWLLLGQEAHDHARLALGEVPGTEPVEHLQRIGKYAGEAASKYAGIAQEVRDRLLAAAP